MTNNTGQNNDIINNADVSSNNNDNSQCVSASDFMENNGNIKKKLVTDNTENEMSVIWKRLQNETGLQITFDDSVHVDDGVAAVKILNDNDLVSAICTTFDDSNVDVIDPGQDNVCNIESVLDQQSTYDENDGMELVDRILSSPSLEEIIKSLDIIRRKILTFPGVTDDIFDCYSNIKHFVLNE